MAIIGWARVSTQDQDLEAQIKALKAAGVDDDHLFIGKRSGAGKENEDKLAEMIRFVRKGDIVVCSKMDRLARSLKQVLGALEAIAEKGATFRTLDGSVDTTDNSPFAKAQLQLISVFAELERSLIVTRTTEGRQEAKARGQVFGRKPKVEEEQQRADIIQRYQAGQSIYGIAKETGFTRQIIYRVLDKAGIKRTNAE